MIDISTARITGISASWVGNKNRYEGVRTGKTLSKLSDVSEEILIPAFLKPFEKSEEFFHFDSERNEGFNQAENACAQIFQHPETLYQWAEKLSGYLYEASQPTKVLGGEFLVAYIEDLLLDGEAVNCIALWKIQNKETFLRPEKVGPDGIALDMMMGIDTHVAENLALIFDMDASEGYRICALDTVSKKDERSFWKDDFLQILPNDDNYFQTRHWIAVASEFIVHKAPFKLGWTRLETIHRINRAKNYFQDNDEFEVDDFSGKVFTDIIGSIADTDEQREAFRTFADEYAKGYAIELENSFDLSRQAVKKFANQAFKTDIKLDKNFKLSVIFGEGLIERGADEDGKKFYKVYFENEE